MSSSSWTIDMPGTGWAMTAMLGLCSAAGRDTSSIAPAERRSDFATVLPFTTTWPSAARSAAFVRDTPKRRATPASTRSPSRPSGTRTVRTSGIVTPLRLSPVAAGRRGRVGLRCPVVAAAVDADPQKGEQHVQTGGGHDPDVGDVADEPPVVVDEVDDVALAATGWPHEPVGEVADRRTEQQSEVEGPGTRAQLT